MGLLRASADAIVVGVGILRDAGSRTPGGAADDWCDAYDAVNKRFVPVGEKP